MIWRLQRFGRDWNELARRNPFGAILTGGNDELAEWNVDEFFETGKADAARFMADLERIAPTARRCRLLDFGCGVGRVTRALADHFQSVVGMDVAPTMIRRARLLNRSYAHCTFVVNRRAHLRRFRSGTFDVIYSRLVLQHVPPALVRVYIPEFLRLLVPGGVLMFQMPDEITREPEESFLNAPVVGGRLKQQLPRALVRAYRRVKYWSIVDESLKRMAMFGMPHDCVLTLAREAGARVLAVAPDQSHGLSPRGYEYWMSR
jgi:trans-aconitate methyltransferase